VKHDIETERCRRFGLRRPHAPAQLDVERLPTLEQPTAAGQIVYGVYLVDVAAGVVRWQGRFATPKTCDVGATFAVNPIITARAVVSEVEV